MKYVYRVELNLSFDRINGDSSIRDNTNLVKKIIAEDYRDVISKIEKLFVTWWDDPETLKKEGFSIESIAPKSLKWDIIKLERGTLIDIE